MLQTPLDMRTLAFCFVLVTASMLYAQEDRAAAMVKSADSLRDEWRVLWSRSDSMRVASMLLRMRSDSLKREAVSLVAAHRSDSMATMDSLHDVSLRRLYATAIANLQRKNAAVLTVSDSLTAAIMVSEPDSGVASFYANAFHGRKTSSGEAYNMNDRTCAHRWLPFGTPIRVRNLANGKETVVRVNDRGPWKHGRIIDVSKGAAQDLDMIRAGTTRVELRVEPDRPLDRIDKTLTLPAEEP